ncbi:MAG: Triosephosphate isomerase [Clostridia bacterium 41_269]|nr:MAG: Triosephosphate isomerase [Clostridia bacterium 41_269]
MRIPLIVGNWKMNLTTKEAASLVEKLKSRFSNIEGVEVAVCPPFTSLETVSKLCKESSIHVGAQNMFWEEQGAYTGEISPLMLKDLGCKYVILGHSERRQFFGETNENVSRKVKSALKHNIIPIICVGETLAQREAGETDRVCREQLQESLKGIDNLEGNEIVVAYEPVWAIGTGKTASPKDADHVANFIRLILANMYSAKTAERVRILYGGSVKPENIVEFMAQPNIDGALVGGASLKADSFGEIVHLCLV